MTSDELRTIIRDSNAVISFELEYRDDAIRCAIANKWSARWIADTKWDANKRIQRHKRMIAEQYELMARYRQVDEAESTECATEHNYMDYKAPVRYSL